VGKGGHWPKGRGTWDKPALLEKDFVFDITGQEGRRFWGVTTISGGGEKADEPFIGELTGKDNTSFVFAGQLDGGDTLSFCYMHAGGKSTYPWLAVFPAGNNRQYFSPGPRYELP